VIVAVTAVWMVQLAIHKVINMVAVRYGFMAAVEAVRVGLPIDAAVVARRTFVRVHHGNLNLMVVDMIAVDVMQMAIVKVIGVAVMSHGRVPTVWAMHVAVSPRVLMVGLSHDSILSIALVTARRGMLGTAAIAV
jgi:hypothetical protein